MAAEDETCGTCSAWKVSPIDPTVGECKAESPTISGSDARFDTAVWPIVRRVDCCQKYTKKD